MEFEHIELLHYFMYFGASLVILLIFSKVYLVVTPYDEMKLIRQGHGAAAISFAGTLIGYCLTLAASAIYNNSIAIFVIWAVVGMIVQLLGYVFVSKVIGHVEEHMEHNNMAVGGLIGLTGLVLGIINAGCLS